MMRDVTHVASMGRPPWQPQVGDPRNPVLSRHWKGDPGACSRVRRGTRRLPARCMPWRQVSSLRNRIASASPMEG
jgi:hypothetical protein